MKESHFLEQIFSQTRYSPAELSQIIPKFKKRSFAKNDFLIQEGKVSNCYWFVETGLIRSYVLDTEGADISMNFFTDGDIVIEWASFFMRQPTRENFQALSPTVCWELDYESFQELFNSIETFREHGRSNLVGDYFALKKKGISMLADPAILRYQQLLEERPELIKQVPLKQLASYLGVTDTSLSRIRRSIAKK